MKFYLGTHKAVWLTRPEFADVPLFISHRTLRTRATLPRALGRWALDSGGFTELTMFSQWRTPAAEYVEAVRSYAEGIGGLDWASPQDWMCEDVMLAKTGLTVAEHQRRTIASVLELRAMAPDLPFIPVLQGQTVDDYLRHVDLYRAAGVELTEEPTVGVGSVCRRQATAEIGALVTTLADEGLALHGFGVKKAGLARYGAHLASADSMAWSFNARYDDPLPGCRHAGCQNCPVYALAWRARVLEEAA